MPNDVQPNTLFSCNVKYNILMALIADICCIEHDFYSSLGKMKEIFGVTWVVTLQKEPQHNTMQFDMHTPNVRKELKNQIKLLYMHFWFFMKLSKGVS